MSVATAHAKSIRTPFAEMVADLESVLSRRLVAYIAGVRDARTISRWANGETSARSDKAETRLRAAYNVVDMLREFDPDPVIKAFFLGSNPYLGDRSPSDMLRDDEYGEVADAAKIFIQVG